MLSKGQKRTLARQLKVKVREVLALVMRDADRQDVVAELITELHELYAEYAPVPDEAEQEYVAWINNSN